MLASKQARPRRPTPVVRNLARGCSALKRKPQSYRNRFLERVQWSWFKGSEKTESTYRILPSCFHRNTATMKRTGFKPCSNLVLVLLVQASPGFPESQEFGKLIWVLKFCKAPLRTFLAFSPNQLFELCLIGKPLRHIHATCPPPPLLPHWKH